MTITVFTPCYNRSGHLRQLYESLLIQNHKDFEWLIVDDGSTDNSKQLIEGFINDDILKIKYFYKNNGGKHTAINYGVKKAKKGLFFIVDSDDYLVENAIELHFNAWQAIRSNSKIAGIIGLSKFRSGEIVGDSFLKENWQIPFADYYLKYNLTGDKSIAFKTDILEQFPFPEKVGVRFVFEAVVWHEMAKKYDVICLNNVIQIKEYLEFGLTDSSNRRWYAKSMAFSYANLIENETHPFSKYPKVFIWNYIYLALYSLLSDENYLNELKFFHRKIIYYLVFPRAYYSYVNMRKLLID